jgi:anthranilate synthase component 2
MSLRFGEKPCKNVIIVDNLDSFTFNIAQMVAKANGVEPIVLSNRVPWREIKKIPHDRLIISPGPGSPTNALDVGASMDVIRHAACPVLGVCLGHQCMVTLYGGTVDRAPEPFHGRISRIRHDNQVLFTGIPNEFDVTRYHSLIAYEPLPPCLEVIATSRDGLVMAVHHRTRPQWGVQFHPESICSDYGLKLFSNFLSDACKHPHTHEDAALEYGEI